jgi:hypothetical protein
MQNEGPIGFDEVIQRVETAGIDRYLPSRIGDVKKRQPP